MNKQLEVFGSHGVDTSVGKVSSAICGKRVTAVIVKAVTNDQDIELAYKRATAADPWNSTILMQLDAYRRVNKKNNCKDESLKSSRQSKCILCTQYLCPLCQLKNDFRDILSPLLDRTESGRPPLKDIIHSLIGHGPS